MDMLYNKLIVCGRKTTYRTLICIRIWEYCPFIRNCQWDSIVTIIVLSELYRYLDYYWVSFREHHKLDCIVDRPANCLYTWRRQVLYCQKRAGTKRQNYMSRAFGRRAHACLVELAGKPILVPYRTTSGQNGNKKAIEREGLKLWMQLPCSKYYILLLRLGSTK